MLPQRLCLFCIYPIYVGAQRAAEKFAPSSRNKWNWSKKSVTWIAGEHLDDADPCALPLVPRRSASHNPVDTVSNALVYLDPSQTQQRMRWCIPRDPLSNQDLAQGDVILVLQALKSVRSLECQGQ